MSTFAVEVVDLDDVLPHPNADALELAVIGGYRAVVKLGQFRKGDRVVYIPEAAVVPDDILEHIGLTGRLSGGGKNRVKAVRLRGELSQGIVVGTRAFAELLTPERVNIFAELYPDNIVLDGTTPGAVITPPNEESEEGAKVEAGWTVILWEAEMDLQFIYGIKKWVEPIPVNLRGRVTNRPAWFPKYDLENYKKYNRVFDEGEEVVITEKLHGTNAGFAMRREDRELLVGSRNWVLELEPEKTFDQQNVYWRMAIDYDAKIVLNKILDQTDAEYVIIFGEIFGSGVQDLTYGTFAGEQFLRVFDIVLDGRYVDYDEQKDLLSFRLDVGFGPVTILAIPLVPVLYRGPFSDAVVREHTDGTTTMGEASHTREGVVIRPVKERTSGKLGRVILKNVSGDYLTRKGGTEFN